MRAGIIPGSAKKEVKSELLIILLTLPHLKSGFFEQFDLLDTLIDGWRIASFIIVCIWYFFIRKKISKIVILLCVIESYLLIDTIFQRGNIYGCAKSAFSILGIALLYDMLEDFKDEFLRAQLFCFETVIYINLFTEIAFPSGLYQGTLYSANWFLGYYNTHTRYFIPALMIAYIYMNYSGKKIRTYLLTAAIFVSAILVWSGGVVCALGSMAITYMIFKNRTAVFNYFNYWLLHIVFFVLVILMKFQNYFKWLIDGLLGKWGSLTGRMLVWQAGLALVKASFLFGYGVEYDEIRKRHFVWAVHSHNQLLEILCQGGIIYLALMVWLIVMTGKRLSPYRNHEMVKAMSAAFLGWCVHSLVEPYTTAFLMGMFVIGYHSESYIAGSYVRKV